MFCVRKYGGTGGSDWTGPGNRSRGCCGRTSLRLLISFVESIADAIAGIGGRDVVVFLIDYAHVELTPHPDVLPHAEDPDVASLDGSMAGRAFTSQSALAVERDDGWHVWVPVSERADRLGVLAMTLPKWDEQIETWCLELGLAAAPLLLASAQYTDLPHLLRRRHRMDLAAEMQWALLPPLSFTAAGTSVAGLLEPAYEVGGDCFDYAYNGGVLDFAMFDMVGHGLQQRGAGRVGGRRLPARTPSRDGPARALPVRLTPRRAPIPIPASSPPACWPGWTWPPAACAG